MRIVENALHLVAARSLPAHHLGAGVRQLAQMRIENGEGSGLVEARAVERRAIPLRRRAGRRVGVEQRLAVGAGLQGEDVVGVLARQPLAPPAVAGAGVARELVANAVGQQGDEIHRA